MQRAAAERFYRELYTVVSGQVSNALGARELDRPQRDDLQKFQKALKKYNPEPVTSSRDIDELSSVSASSTDDTTKLNYLGFASLVLRFLSKNATQKAPAARMIREGSLASVVEAIVDKINYRSDGGVGALLRPLTDDMEQATSDLDALRESLEAVQARDDAELAALDDRLLAKQEEIARLQETLSELQAQLHKKGLTIEILEHQHGLEKTTLTAEKERLDISRARHVEGEEKAQARVTELEAELLKLRERNADLLTAARKYEGLYRAEKEQTKVLREQRDRAYGEQSMMMSRIGDRSVAGASLDESVWRDGINSSTDGVFIQRISAQLGDIKAWAVKLLVGYGRKLDPAKEEQSTDRQIVDNLLFAILTGRDKSLKEVFERFNPDTQPALFDGSSDAVRYVLEEIRSKDAFTKDEAGEPLLPRAMCRYLGGVSQLYGSKTGFLPKFCVDKIVNKVRPKALVAFLDDGLGAITTAVRQATNNDAYRIGKTQLGQLVVGKFRPDAFAAVGVPEDDVILAARDRVDSAPSSALSAAPAPTDA